MKQKNIHPFISVMGTLGVGKTTAVELIAKKFNAYPAYESFEENVFLPRFYADMKRWGFTYQVFFLMEKINQLKTIAAQLKTATVVQDAPIMQYVYSYTKAQHTYGNIDEAEWSLYQRIYLDLGQQLPEPDITIYLDASVDTILSRIKKRGRPMEQQIPRSYIELLHSLNETWIQQSKTPVYIIDTEKLNITEEKGKEDFITRLEIMTLPHTELHG